MRRLGTLCAAAALLVWAGCGGSGTTVVPISAVPDINHSALDPFVDYGKAVISPDKLFIVIHGKAKANLGQRMKVKIQRFKDGQPLDSKDGYVTLNKPSEVPAGPPPPQPGGPGGDPIDERREPPPPPPDIDEGDPVQLLVDASCEGGKITKLVITPVAGGARRR